MKQGRPANAIADMLDVTSRVSVEPSSATISVATDVRVGRAEIHTPVGSLITKRAFVQLVLDGLQIVPGQRLGDVIKAPTTEEIKSSEISSEKLGGGFELSGAGSTTAAPDAAAKIKADAARTREKRREMNSTTVLEHSAVKARGGNRWEIFEGGAELEGNYIQARSTLCQLEKHAGSNRASVAIEGIVYRRDLEFRAERRGSMFTNKEKVILAILAQSLNSDAAEIGPTVRLSSQEFTDE